MSLGSGDGNKKKNKFMIGIIAGIIGGLFPAILIPAVVTSGVSAVADFVSDVGDKIGDFFTPDDLLEELGDETSITEKDLEGWMITRNSMLHLLVEAEKFNNRLPRTKEFEVEEHTWWDERVPLPTPTPEPTPEPDESEESTGTTEEITATPAPTAAPVPQYTIEKKESTGYVSVVITEEKELIDRYKVSWQLAYMLLIYRYMDTYETQNLIFDIPTVEIDLLLDELEPMLVYEFDPISYWPLKKKLSKSEIEEHPHDYVYFEEHVTSPNIVDGIIHHELSKPKMRIKEVLLPYGKDIYEYKWVRVADGVYKEVLTYRREYDKEKFLGIIKPYLGDREVDAFLAAFELMPDVEDLYAELEMLLETE